MEELLILPNNVFLSLSTFLLSILIFFILWVLFTRKIKFLAAEHGMSWINTAFQRSERTIKYFIVLTSIYFSAIAAGAQRTINDAMFLLRLAFIYLVMLVIYRLFEAYFQHKKEDSKHFSVVFSLMKRTVLVLFVIIFALFVIETLNIQMGQTAMIMTLFSLAFVFFSFFPLIKDVIAGVYLIETGLKIGDYIEVSKRVRGFLKEIGNLKTSIVGNDGREILIPNSWLFSKVIHNESVSGIGATQRAKLVMPAKIKKKFLEKKIAKVFDKKMSDEDIVKDYRPILYTHDISDDKIGYILYYQTREFGNIKKIRSILLDELSSELKEKDMEFTFL